MKLKHLYMLGAVALMTASCNEDRFLAVSYTHLTLPTN